MNKFDKLIEEKMKVYSEATNPFDITNLKKTLATNNQPTGATKPVSPTAAPTATTATTPTAAPEGSTATPQVAQPQQVTPQQATPNQPISPQQKADAIKNLQFVRDNWATLSKDPEIMKILSQSAQPPAQG